MGYSTGPMAAFIAAAAAGADPALPTGTLGSNITHISGRENSGALVLPTTGVLLLSAMALRAGVPITNMNFRTGTTAATLPTNWWVALYDSALNCMGQSTDQLTGAIAASSIFTKALDSIPVTAGARVASTTVTLTFPTLSQSLTSLIAVNDSVAVSNANIAAYNGTFTVTGVTATTITYTAGGSATDNLAAPFPTVQLAAGKRTIIPATSGLFFAGLSIVSTAQPTMTGVAIGALAGSLTAPEVNGSSTAGLTGTAPSPAAALTRITGMPWFWAT